MSVLPPTGFRVATIPWAYSTFTVAGQSYFYANGLYYTRVKKQYEVTKPPVGAVIPQLPEGHEEALIDGKTFYTYDDTFYKASGEGYELIGFLAEESK